MRPLAPCVRPFARRAPSIHPREIICALPARAVANPHHFQGGDRSGQYGVRRIFRRRKPEKGSSGARSSQTIRATASPDEARSGCAYLFPGP